MNGIHRDLGDQTPHECGSSAAASDDLEQRCYDPLSGGRIDRNPSERCRISVLTDNRVFGELLAGQLNATLRIGLDDLHWIENSLPPDVVLIDASLDPSSTSVERAVRRCRVQRLSIMVIACSDEALRAARWVDLGADALSYCDASLADLESTLARLFRGETLIGVGTRESLLRELRADRASHRDRESLFDKLTRREMEVLRLLAQASTPEEIARENYVSLNTVRTQIRSILAKLSTTSVVGAVALAYSSGWMGTDPFAKAD